MNILSPIEESEKSNKTTEIQIAPTINPTPSEDLISNNLNESNKLNSINKFLISKKNFSFQGKHSKFLKNLVIQETFLTQTLNKQSIKNKKKYYRSVDKYLFKQIQTEIKDLSIEKKNKNEEDIDLFCEKDINKENNITKIYFSNKKNKKLYINLILKNENLFNENKKLIKENQNLKEIINKLKDEIEIMRDEDKINKEIIQENENKFNNFSDLIKIQIKNYENKIFNIKELLFKKDNEIKKLNENLEKLNIDSKNVINGLKNKILKYKDEEEEIKDNNLNDNLNKKNINNIILADCNENGINEVNNIDIINRTKDINCIEK